MVHFIQAMFNKSNEIRNFTRLLFLENTLENSDKYDILSTDKLQLTLRSILVFMVFYTIYFFFITPDDWFKHSANILGIVLVAATSFLLKKYNNKTLILLITNFFTSGLIFSSLMNSGGIYSIDIEWYLFASISSFLFVGLGYGIVISVVNFLLVLFLYYLELIHYKDFKLDSIKTNGLHEFFTFTFIQIIYATTLYYFIKKLLDTRKELDAVTQQKIEDLNELVEKRTEENLSLRNDIARDFHDVMGNKLASISSLSQMLQMKIQSKEGEMIEELMRINRLSKEVYEGTKDFIWALNIQQNNLFYVYLYIKDFAGQLFQSSNIEFISYPAEDHLEKIELTPFVSSQLTLILKEALTNALVHSHASSVSFEIRETQDLIEFILSDDGIGFDIHQLKRVNGLDNMKVRAKKIGAELTISSKPGITTIVALRFNKKLLSNPM